MLSDVVSGTKKSSLQSVLGHELVHGLHAKLGNNAGGFNFEIQAVGLKQFRNEPITENTIRSEQGDDERIRYSDPKLYPNFSE